MNDELIRSAFHRTILRWHHAQSETRVFDEFGLCHGRTRADIVVVNGSLLGYEIKSDQDLLRRLRSQIESYTAVFDRISIIVAPRHLQGVVAFVPPFWGVICATEGPRGGVRFERVRSSVPNPSVDDYAVAQLLWRNEAVELLAAFGVTGPRLREPRSGLYRYLVEIADPRKLRQAIRGYLKKRPERQHLERRVPSGGSSQPIAT